MGTRGLFFVYDYDGKTIVDVFWVNHDAYPDGLGAVVVKMIKNITRWLKDNNNTLSQYLLNFLERNKYSNIQKINAENTLDDLMKKYQADVWCEYIYGLQITNNRIDRVIFSYEYLHDINDYRQNFSVLKKTEFERLVKRWNSTDFYAKWNSSSERERQKLLKPDRKWKRKRNDNVSVATNCVVCFNENIDENDMYVLPCQHGQDGLCLSCAEQYRQRNMNTCPLCRNKLWDK